VAGVQCKSVPASILAAASTPLAKGVVGSSVEPETQPNAGAKVIDFAESELDFLWSESPEQDSGCD
jgi:hypothetical protein